MNPFFTIIIPVYNRANRLPTVLDSLMNQEFKNFETIIVDDCSTDNSYQIALDHTLPNKIVLRNEKNSERCITRNKGIDQAKGNYICFLDSDDLFLSNHLLTFYEHIENLEESNCLLFANSYLEYEDGNKVEKKVPNFPKEDIFSYLLQYTPNPARVCVSRSIVETYKFDPEIPGLEDLDLWLRIASCYPVIHIQKYTNVYYIHDDMYTLADPKRYENELAFFKKIFAKKELKGLLPRKSRNRLLSMCHFHLSQQYQAQKQKTKMYSSILKSFFLYPKGYNGKTNKILLVSFIYNFPLLGPIFRRLKK